MIPLFAFLYNRGKSEAKNYSIIKIFPYFVLGFVGMIIIRNFGDHFFINISNNNWENTIEIVKSSSKVSLTMAMAAIGLSTNLKDLKSMGYKPFIVGLIAMITVGLVSIITMQSFIKIFLS